tara:strand:- start:8880 stop:9272 length:393 start_codon:yes stop_codon:yes gene_type:complete
VKRSQVQLTWAGFDAAIDLISAQTTRRTCSGVYGPTSPGTVMAIALAHRLDVPRLTEPENNMLLVDAWGWNRMLAEFSYNYEDVSVWVWVDTTPYFYNAVCHMEGVSCVSMPWQDAAHECLEYFIPDFHD